MGTAVSTGKERSLRQALNALLEGATRGKQADSLAGVDGGNMGDVTVRCKIAIISRISIEKKYFHLMFSK